MKYSFTCFCFFRFSEEYSFEHCRGHPGGEKWKRKDESKLYKVLSFADWRIGGAEFRKHEDFGLKIKDAGEFLPSAKFIEQWRQKNRPDYIYETTLPHSYGASERLRPLNDNQRVLDHLMKVSSKKYETW